MASVISRTLKGGAGFFIANVVSRGFGFAFVFVASRVLGPGDFGVLALGLSVMGIARRFAAFGLPNTIPRFLSGEGEENAERLYGTILFIGGLTALAVGLTLFGTAPWVALSFGEETLISPLRVLSVAIVVGVGYQLLQAVLEAQERAWQVAGAQSIRSVTKVGLLLPFFLWSQTATSAAWAVVGGFVLGTLWEGRQVLRLQFRPLLSIQWSQIRRIVGYSAPLMIVGFSYFLGQQADRLMLGWLGNSTSVGTYTVASKLAMAVGAVQGALYSIFKPIASQGYRNKSDRRVQEAYLFISRWIALINGVVLLVFVAVGPLILHIFGSGYSTKSTFHVLVVLSSFYFLAGWVGPTGPLLQMSDGHKAEFYNTLIFIVSNISLNYMLIPWYGSIGAAWATLISSGARNVLQVSECIYWFGIEPHKKGKLWILGIVLVSGLVSVSIASNILKVSTAVFGIVLLILSVLVTRTEEEVNMYRKVVASRIPVC